MHFGMFMQFETRPGGTQSGAFAEGFELIDAAEAMGLDGAWLAEMHFTPDRSVLSSPITIASSIATRTQRLRIGMAVYVLPLNNPLRIAEEVATVDQISEGRFDFGIGRSGFARSYDIYGVPYAESHDRFREALDVILQAWQGEPFSYAGEFYQGNNATVAPLPYQRPHPPLRMAATTAETFPRAGADGFPIFVGLRGMDIPELRHNLKAYRQAWRDAGHDGDGNVSLRVPVYVGLTQAGAVEEPFESIQAYFGRMGRLYEAESGSAGIEQTELRDQRAARLAEQSYEDILSTKVAFGTTESLVDRFAQLREELGLDGVVAELNAGGMIPHDVVLRNIRLLTEKLCRRSNSLPNSSRSKDWSDMKVAILDDYQSVAAEMADWSSLPSGIEVSFFADHLSDENTLAERLAGFDIVMGMRERTAFPRSLLARLPNLRCLITTGARNASFDIDAATEFGITVCGTQGAGEGPTELTWGLIIGLLRRIAEEDRITRAEGKWGAYVGTGLKGKTLGLLGLGHIGSLVARVGVAFDMRVIAWSQNLTAERAAECGATLVDKDTLFSEGDVVSVHVRLSDRTLGLVGAHEIGLMKPSAILVNISRGPIVDEPALVNALERRAIGGAALDTFDVEPLPVNHPFLTLDNTLITPHVGYVTDDGYRAFYAGVVENIRAFAVGEAVRVINPEVMEAGNLRGPA